MAFKNIYSILLFLSFFCIASCKSQDAATEESATTVQTPVEVTHILHQDMSDAIELNATAVFLLKHFVKANATGYLTMGNIHLGDVVAKGQLLFSVKTKESVSLGNSLNVLDSTFKFSGSNSIKASDNGFITQLDHQTGDYVQDGEQLAAISNVGSFVFLMNMPYEYHAAIHLNQIVQVVLPDSEVLAGTIASMMPSVDSVSQTQNVVIKVKASHVIPENLVAKVRIQESMKGNVVAVPKSSVLTDETQSEFWIMKMKGNALAVKVPIQKGFENGTSVEIISPVLSDSDLILTTGNYGLDDSSKVKIVKVLK